MTEITEKIVRDRLLRLFPARDSLVAFNICGIGPYPWEMDFARVMDSGFVQEFEIKVTKADICNEVKKLWKQDDLQHRALRRHFDSHGRTDAMMGEIVLAPYRHKRVSPLLLVPHIHYHHCIREFYVVVPSECALADFALSALPPWVGVLEISPVSHLWQPCVRRKAKKLPLSRPITDDEKMQVIKSTYYRYWSGYHGGISNGRGSKKLRDEQDSADRD